ncbi:MAG: hypothetical protein JWL68_5352 [Actinomycetia bacterium]|nr:hypothetical protein [Actinomycetes bacterium]
MAVKGSALRDTAASIRRSAQDPLGIYLNDHLAGATGGLELARRVARAGQVPAPQPELRRFAEEVAEDREMLLRIMGTLGVPVRSYKVWAAWAGEKAGRLKPNGRLTTRSPLSNLVELEMLRLGVEGKAAGWRTLRELADRDARLDAGQLDRLISQARRQADFLEEARVRAALQVIAAAGDSHG